ncbi:tyrosine-type recombinase/integrase [Bacillus xiamenensis]|uniref:tyrosine-type recombinase/integrase n=1 Tax=Bacillus xiamenensis TaxID=1178537 RepID=UPI00028C89DC|nr:tyrosine-type recombinase/integrase [Bacillus xiamenensis]EKF35642.1 tyrosine recombinase XerC [Bacillus xiamenensis]
MIASTNGKDIGTFGINKAIDSILSKTNLHHITPHGLRHTHAIMLLESGVDIKTVSDRLGHATINMTADVYLHVTKKHETESVLKSILKINRWANLFTHRLKPCYITRLNIFSISYVE